MARSNVWMSVSDLMTGLMVIFLFISIAYIKKVQEQQTNLTEYVEVRKNLHKELVAEFENEIDDGSITITGDLSLRFEEAETFFELGESNLNQTFKDELDECIPRYLDILLNSELRTNIKEIRIEGHTDTVCNIGKKFDPYMANLIVSQRRALNVMQYIRKMQYFQDLAENNKRQLEYWFTANGMSYGRALDKEGEYVYISGKPIDCERSRRVELRLICSGDEILSEVIGKNEEHNADKKRN